MKGIAFMYNTKSKVENLRKMSRNDIYEIMQIAKSNEDIEIYVKWLFYLGDIKYGFGRRDLLECGLLTLTDDVNFFKKIIRLVPQYSRWDVLVDLAWDLKEGIGVDIANANICRSEVLSFICQKLNEDFMNRGNDEYKTSLLAKWMPSINASSSITRAKAGMIREYLHVSAKTYRAILKDLREKLDVVESKMSANKWGDIDTATIPTVALRRYSKALLRHDIKKEPHANDTTKTISEAGKESVGEQIKEINNLLQATPREYILPILDCEGYMDCTSVKAYGMNTNARAIGAAASLHVTSCPTGKGRLRDTIFTVYNSTHLGMYNRKNANEPSGILIDNGFKSVGTKDMSGQNTNKQAETVGATLNNLINYAVNNKLDPKEIPSILFFITCDSRKDLSNRIAKVATAYEPKFRIHGYKMPRIIVWYIYKVDNVAIKRYNYSVPTVLIDGYADDVIDTLLNTGYDPFSNFMCKLRSERYEQLDDIIATYNNKGGISYVQ